MNFDDYDKKLQLYHINERASVRLREIFEDGADCHYKPEEGADIAFFESYVGYKLAIDSEFNEIARDSYLGMINDKLEMRATIFAKSRGKLLDEGAYSQVFIRDIGVEGEVCKMVVIRRVVCIVRASPGEN
jgi:hypothetical protein